MGLVTEIDFGTPAPKSDKFITLTVDGADVRVEEAAKPIQLWAEARFTLMRRYEGRGYVGEKYALQNVSLAPMVLAEQEFDRPDSRAGGEITGIAIEHHNLRPGETTSVYVIRRGGTR